MHYFALATDYDGTIASGGRVPDDVVGALERVAASGRKLILVTGRELEQLIEIFPAVGIFDVVVAENGALLYDPKSKTETSLADPPPAPFVQRLRERGLDDVRVGRSIVATWTPHETTVLEVIQELGLEWHIIFNKGAVMVLPSTVSKASGLVAALAGLRLSPRNVVGVGDAENDQAFLHLCECSAAVANALPSLKESVDLVTAADHGAGVQELIAQLLDQDLRGVERCAGRRKALIGWDAASDEEYAVSPWGTSVLFTGSSGGGKSTAATGLVERLSEAGYQYCIIDPEGDYERFLDAIVLGGKDRIPTAEEILDVLQGPDRDLVVNLLGVPLHDRPAYFGRLLPRLQELRTKTGRPHWILIDEAHHLMPQNWEPAALTMPQSLEGMLYITVHPDLMAPVALASVDVVVALGQAPAKALATFARVTGRRVVTSEHTDLEPGHALVWDARSGEQARHIKVKFGKQARKRHTRKYVEGDLGPERSFYFRGPAGKLNLQAQNLMLFSQIAAGVDDETWQHHLDRHDYSRWFREVIKDSSLAARAEAIENAGLAPADARRRIREAIEVDYTLPASRASGWQSDEPGHQTTSGS
jgi:hydroxymethylpyrimidine pyrophosphatase-like HAD family hydrolase